MKREKLIAARERKHWNRRVLADRVGVDVNTLYRWEHGLQGLRGHNIAALCNALGQSAQDLGLEPGQQEVPEELQAERRHFLQSTLAATGAAIVTPSSMLEQFAHILAKSSSIGVQHLTTLEEQTMALWRYRDDNILLPVELYNSLQRYIHHIIQLLDAPLLPSIHAQVLALACKLFTLGGALLYDVGEFAQAREHYRLACAAAQQAEHPHLQAISSTWMCFTWTDEHNAHEAATQIAQSRFLLKDAHADRRTHAWVAAVAAEAAAQLGNYTECLTLLDQAEDAFAISTDDEESYLHRFSSGQLRGFRGVCYQLLYDPKKRETVELLEQACNTLEKALLDVSASSRQKQLYRIDLACAYARRGEVERACTLASQTAQEARQTTANNVLQRLQEVHLLLQPWEKAPPVKYLNEALHTVGIV